MISVTPGFVPPPVPRTPKSTATRARILAVASELFLDLGYAGVSMNQIAEQAGLTKGGVYGHFHSKGQLLVEVIRWNQAEREHSAAFVDALTGVQSSIALLFGDDGRSTRLLVLDAAAAARHDPEVAAGMAALDTERQAAMRAALAGIVDDGETVAWIVSALSMGIGMRESIDVGFPEVERVADVLLRLLVPLESR